MGSIVLVTLAGMADGGLPLKCSERSRSGLLADVHILSVPKRWRWSLNPALCGPSLENGDSKSWRFSIQAGGRFSS